MKFKMAPNSLFAVLLRSPWWISFLISGLLAAVAFALLPLEYRVVGALGGAPFVVIGCIALWRQLHRPSAGRAEAILNLVASMSWPEFATLLEQGFAGQGFTVERESGGVDFALRRSGATTLVAARRWKAARPGEDALKALHDAARARDAKHCLYVTLGELSANAQSFAKRNNVELMQGPGLANLLHHVKLPA
jgi:restriction system protein